MATERRRLVPCSTGYRVQALYSRGINVHIKKVKAHTSDENVAAKEQQARNWLADHWADQGAQACQLTGSEIQPFLKKDRMLWQLYSRMFA
eukprot:5638123-Karenia_brevis.AAC.1